MRPGRNAGKARAWPEEPDASASTPVGRRTAQEASRDPRSPDALRRRRGPDLRLLLPAGSAWAAVAATIATRSWWVTGVAAMLGVVIVGALCLPRVQALLRWRRTARMAAWNLVVALLIAAIAAGGATVQVSRVDRHPLMQQLDGAGAGGATRDGSGPGSSAPGGPRGHYRGEATVAGGARVLAGGTVKVPVRIAGLGELALFVNERHRSPELLGAQPGTTVEVAATVRPDDRPGLVPASLSATRAPIVQRPPAGLMGVSARLRSNINDLARSGPMAWLANRAGFAGAEALIPGMLIGDISQMPHGVRQRYIVSGLSHLTAVSGLHVAVLISAVTIAATASGASRRARWLLVMGTLVAFTVVVGPLPSILRAGFMGMVGAVAVLSSRWSDSLAALSAAVLAVMLLRPAMAVEYGLALSVLATLAIVVASPNVGRWLILRWARLTQARWGRQPRNAEGMVLRAVAVSLVADVATQPVIVMMTGIVSPAAVPANLAVGFAVAPLMVLALGACLLGSVAMAFGVPVGLAAWLLLPSAPAAWWIHAVAGWGSHTWVLHTPGGPGWALVWALGLLAIALAVMGRLWWQTIPVLIAAAMVLVRVGTWQLGPYDAASQDGWGSDLSAYARWSVAICGPAAGESGWQLRYPTGERQACGTPRGQVRLRAGGVLEKGQNRGGAASDSSAGTEGAPRVVAVADEGQALTVRGADLIVVVGCVAPGDGEAQGSEGSTPRSATTQRSRGRPSRTPDGVPVHYPCADGAGLLTPEGLVVSGGPR